MARRCPPPRSGPATSWASPARRSSISLIASHRAFRILSFFADGFVYEILLRRCRRGGWVPGTRALASSDRAGINSVSPTLCAVVVPQMHRCPARVAVAQVRPADLGPAELDLTDAVGAQARSLPEVTAHDLSRDVPADDRYRQGPPNSQRGHRLRRRWHASSRLRQDGAEPAVDLPAQLWPG